MPNFQENYNQYNEPFPWMPESSRLPNPVPGSDRQADPPQGQIYRAPYSQSGPNWQPNPQQGHVYRAPYPQQGLPAIPYAAAVPSGVEREKLRPKQGARMPKAEALSLVQSLKKWVIVASIAAFALFSALVAGNLRNTASATQSTPSNQITNPSTPSNSSNNSGGFFGNQGGGGYGFGNGGSTQAPGTGTHVS